MSKICLGYLECVITSIKNIKNGIITFIKDKRRKKDFFSENLFNTEEEQPAKILSSEEIGNMINNQIKYNEEKINLNEYKIVKENKEEDVNLNLNELKSEIQQVEFEDDDEIEKKKINNNNNNNLDSENIEDLKKQVFNNTDI